MKNKKKMPSAGAGGERTPGMRLAVKSGQADRRMYERKTGRQEGFVRGECL